MDHLELFVFLDDVGQQGSREREDSGVILSGEAFLETETDGFGADILSFLRPAFLAATGIVRGSAGWFGLLGVGLVMPDASQSSQNSCINRLLWILRRSRMESVSPLMPQCSPSKV